MENEVNMLMVFCAAVAALAFGVLLGYVCCKSLFDLLRFHSRSLAVGAKAETRVAQI